MSERPVTRLPEFPRPDLPASHPLNYDTLRIRVMRRLNLPDDGGLWIHDAIQTVILEGYHALIIVDDSQKILIRFETLADACAWAEAITTMSHDREMVSFETAPTELYGPAILKISL